MTSKASVPASGDSCDKNLVNVDAAPALSDRQRRFLDAYPAQQLFIARAARVAGVARCTVYRWRRDDAFAAAMHAAAEEFFRAARARVLAENEARQRWRDARELQRLPMRCHYLARAREALARARAAKRRR
jgi:hypothetical protein